MEKQININNDYNSLEKIREFIKKETSYDCTEEYDSWDVRTDSNGQMEKCVLIKKSSMHGMKIFLPEENSLQMTYVIPNKVMNAYFSKSQKRHRNIIEIITGKIKDVVLSSSQERAFDEMEQVFDKIEA